MSVVRTPLLMAAAGAYPAAAVGRPDSRQSEKVSPG